MRKHILLTEGVPQVASKAAVMERAIASFGGLSFDTLRKFPEADRTTVGIFLDCSLRNVPDLLQYQSHTSATPQTDGSECWLEVSVSELSLDDAKAQAITAVASKRWEVENGGTYMGPVFLDTARENRANYVHHNQKSLDDPTHVITNWKVGPGVFTNLDAATIQAATLAVETHIQASYDNEAALVGLIVAAADMAALRAIDFDAGWPSNDPPGP